jgi:hypothetical protein
MKIPKEYILLFILGLFALAYVFDAVVNPLDLNLTSPYQYWNFVGVYPFTTASVAIKAVAIFLAPLWLVSFIEKRFTGKAVFLFVIGSVGQLYAVQDVVTKAEVIPLEWTLSLAFAGLGLVFVAALYFIRGLLSNFGQNLSNAKVEAALERRRREEAESGDE